MGSHSSSSFIQVVMAFLLLAGRSMHPLVAAVPAPQVPGCNVASLNSCLTSATSGVGGLASMGACLLGPQVGGAVSAIASVACDCTALLQQMTCHLTYCPLLLGADILSSYGTKCVGKIIPAEVGGGNGGATTTTTTISKARRQLAAPTSTTSSISLTSSVVTTATTTTLLTTTSSTVTTSTTTATATATLTTTSIVTTSTPSVESGFSLCTMTCLSLVPGLLSSLSQGITPSICGNTAGNTGAASLETLANCLSLCPGASGTGQTISQICGVVQIISPEVTALIPTVRTVATSSYNITAAMQSSASAAAAAAAAAANSGSASKSLEYITTFSLIFVITVYLF